MVYQANYQSRAVSVSKGSPVSWGDNVQLFSQTLLEPSLQKQGESSPKASTRETHKSEGTDRLSLTQLFCHQQTTVKAVYFYSCHSLRSISTCVPPDSSFSPWQQQDPLSLPSQSLNADYVPSPKVWDLAPPLRPVQPRVRHTCANTASSCWGNSRGYIKEGGCMLSLGPLLWQSPTLSSNSRKGGCALSLLQQLIAKVLICATEKSPATSPS